MGASARGGPSKKVWPHTWAPRPNLSMTSDNEFHACPRRYWFSYAPSEFKKQHFSNEIRVQYSLLPWNALAGIVVDDIIRADLRGYLAQRHWIEDLYGAAKDRLAEYRVNTRNWRPEAREGKDYPFGRPNLVDRFYYDDKPPTKEDGAKVKEIIERSLENYTASGLRDYFLAYGTDAWRITLPIKDQPVPWFRMGEVPVYASYDFAIDSPEITLVVDWKTGQQNQWSERKASEQLHTYAGFAMAEWGATLDKLWIMPVWLGAGSQWEPIRVDPSILEAQKRRFAERFADLVPRCRAVDRDPMAMETLFPMTDNLKACADCKFRACPGYSRVAAAAIEPTLASDREEVE